MFPCRRSPWVIFSLYITKYGFHDYSFLIQMPLIVVKRISLTSQLLCLSNRIWSIMYSLFSQIPYSSVTSAVHTTYGFPLEPTVCSLKLKNDEFVWAMHSPLFSKRLKYWQSKIENSFAHHKHPFIHMATIHSICHLWISRRRKEKQY